MDNMTDPRIPIMHATYVHGTYKYNFKSDLFLADLNCRHHYLQNIKKKHSQLSKENNIT